MAKLKLSKKSGAVGVVCSVGTIIAIVLNAGHVRTNERGLELIGNAESCRRDPYVCPAGVLTDGIGNTHDVKADVRKTDEQIARDWEMNILEAEKCVNNYASGKRLSDDTFSAVTSITFNVGCGAMRKSTLYAMLRDGPLPGLQPATSSRAGYTVERPFCRVWLSAVTRRSSSAWMV